MYVYDLLREIPTLASSHFYREKSREGQAGLFRIRKLALATCAGVERHALSQSDRVCRRMLEAESAQRTACHLGLRMPRGCLEAGKTAFWEDASVLYGKAASSQGSTPHNYFGEGTDCGYISFTTCITISSCQATG